MDDKTLAEFAAGYLGLEINSKHVFYPEIVQNGFCSDDNMGNCLPVRCLPLLFFGEGTARDAWETEIVRFMLPPILAHLAKRKLEGEGYTWDSSCREPNPTYPHKYNFGIEKKGEVCPSCESWPISYEEGDDENEFRAMWQAIFEAKGGKVDG